MREQKKGHKKAVHPATGNYAENLMGEVEGLLSLSQEYNLKGLAEVGMVLGENPDIYREIKEIKNWYKIMAKRLGNKNRTVTDHLFTLDMLADIFNGDRNAVVALFLTRKNITNA